MVEVQVGDEDAADVVDPAADRRQPVGQRRPAVVALPAGVEQAEPAAVEGERVDADVAQRVVRDRHGIDQRPSRSCSTGGSGAGLPRLVLGRAGDLHVLPLCQPPGGCCHHGCDEVTDTSSPGLGRPRRMRLLCAVVAAVVVGDGVRRADLQSTTPGRRLRPRPTRSRSPAWGWCSAPGSCSSGAPGWTPTPTASGPQRRHDHTSCRGAVRAVRPAVRARSAERRRGRSSPSADTRSLSGGGREHAVRGEVG